MTNRTFLPLALLLCAPIAAQAEAGRAIRHEAVVEAPPAKLFELWTTSAGARTLFPGADARIDARVGGDFCIMFEPHGDPEGDHLGTHGCSVLSLEQDRSVTFQWKGPDSMPVMNQEPFPTRVRVALEPLDGGRTRITLRHAGFGSGEEWDHAFSYFDRAWKGVLALLEGRFAAQPAVDRSALPKTETLWLARLLPGESWIPGKGPGEQPAILNHVFYMAKLAERGVLVMGGPCGMDNGLAVLRVPDEAAARRFCDADPAVQAGTFRYELSSWRAAIPRRSGAVRQESRH